MNYTYFYKEKYDVIGSFHPGERYDIFIATYNFTDRVKKPPQNIIADEKIWIMLPEYQDDVFLAGKTQYYLKGTRDYEGVRKFCSSLNLKEHGKVCIDSTGFMVPHLLIMLRCLRNHVARPIVDVMYSEADRYADAEKTIFSDSFSSVSQIEGYEGRHVSKMETDLMIIASGYDHSRIRDVANYKKRAAKVQLIGFPSMKADMLQENVLAASTAELFSVCPLSNSIFAPAYDPFTTAQAIKDYIDKKQQERAITNLYMAPLSSKPQALGMALYYLWEDGLNKPVSIVYPECERYVQDNAIGVGRIWIYKNVV